MPKAYVINALRPRGGSYMAYHVGLILQQHFGYEMISAETQEHPPSDQFIYKVKPPLMPLRKVEREMRDDDLMVVNPAFSPLLLGLRLPGRKICYVQDFRTFQILDNYFDLYVSVSSTVAKFLKAVYSMDSPIIPAFIEQEKLPPIIPWQERPPHSCMVYIKNGPENRRVADYMLGKIRAELPLLDLRMFNNNGIPHEEFLRHIGSARYLLNFSMAEGFGLIPLEAMALGTCVTGFDGIAGQDFLRFGKNSMALGCDQAQEIIPTFKRMLGDDAAMMAISRQAIQDAKPYHFDAFSKAWQEMLTGFLHNHGAAQ